jgi:hypothetical protein
MKPYMLRVLHEGLASLPSLLQEPQGWNGLLVTYEQPTVERLWRPLDAGDGSRIHIHIIHPCLEGQAYFHPHPWPMAIRVLEGKYEMGIGFSVDDEPPERFATVMVVPGTEYDMAHPGGWHFVRPLEDPVVSVMVTGKPQRDCPKPKQPNGSLSENRKFEILETFRRHYPYPMTPGQ